MEPSEPVAEGVSSFLKNFGQRIGKAQDNQTALSGKEALENYKAKNKTTLAEDPNKVTAKRNPANPPTGREGDPATEARRKIKPLETIINHLQTFRTMVQNPTGTNPILSQHITELAKVNQAKGLDPTRAINVAINQAFSENYPDQAKALVDASKPGGAGDLFNQMPQLAQEFPLSAQRYYKTPTPVPSAPTGVPANPGPPMPQGGTAPMAQPAPKPMAAPPVVQSQPSVPQVPPPNVPGSTSATPDNQPVVPGNEPTPESGGNF